MALIQNLRCLIVEDDREWQQRFELACMKRGFSDEQIRVAEDKAKALVELDVWEPDIVILDLGIESRKGAGDVHARHGRDVLQRVRELNLEGYFRSVVLIVSGTIDDYDRQTYEEDQCVVRAANKDEVSDALPSLLKRAEKSAIPVFRDLKNHWKEVFPDFEKVMRETETVSEIIKSAYEIANAILRKLGAGIMGSDYPIDPATDDMFARIEILRGHLSRLDTRSRYKGSESDMVWIEGLPYQHFQSIRNYCNCYKHFPRLLPSDKHRCPLDQEVDRSVCESLEKMDHVPHILRPIVLDLLAWYMPWHKRQK